MLYVRAAALFFGSKERDEMRSQSGVSRSSKLDADRHQQITAAFQQFLGAAALDNRKRPHGFYTLALHTLSSLTSRHHGGAKAPTSAVEEACAKASELYEAGVAAEAHLPPFFLPVECSAKDVVPDILTMMRAASQWKQPIKVAGAPRSSSNSSAKARSGAEAVDNAVSNASSDDRNCCGCGKAAVKLMKCSKCKTVSYCSRECQVADWKEHKKVCNVACNPAV